MHYKCIKTCVDPARQRVCYVDQNVSVNNYKPGGYIFTL